MEHREIRQSESGVKLGMRSINVAYEFGPSVLSEGIDECRDVMESTVGLID